MIISCATFGDAPTNGCCGSCHDDASDLGYAMLMVDDVIPGDEISEVCCYVHQWMKENPERARAAVMEAAKRDAD